MTTILAASKSEIFKSGIHEEASVIIVSNPQLLFKTKALLLPIEEVVVNDEYMQVVPFITLFNKATGDVLTYKNLSMEGDATVPVKYSIGIEAILNAESIEGTNFVDILVAAIIDELAIHYGLVDTGTLSANIRNKLINDNCGVLYFPNNSTRIYVTVFIGIDIEDYIDTYPAITEWLSMDTLTTLASNNEVTIDPITSAILNIFNN